MVWNDFLLELHFVGNGKGYGQWRNQKIKFGGAAKKKLI
jgi:hypothetical protein